MSPTRRTFVFALWLLPTAAWSVFVPSVGTWPWLVALAALGALMAVDMALAAAPRQLAVTVDVAATAAIGVDVPLHVAVAAPTVARAHRLETWVDTAPGLEAPAPISMPDVPDTRDRDPTRRAIVPLTTTRRGPTSAEAVRLRWTGPLGLVARQRIVQCATPIAVTLPTLKQYTPTARLLHHGAFHGARIDRYRGDGHEFDTIAEYTPGHDHRRIDWKASARHQAPRVREYRAERNRDVVVCIDTGHLMAAPLGAMSRLDHAILAGQLLALAAVRAGDRAGLLAFDSEVRAFLPPAPGVPAFHALTRAAAELHAVHDETNFTRGLLHLIGSLRRRTLIVLLTDVVDSTTAAIMLDHLARVGRQHLLVFATLSDPDALQVENAAPDTTRALHASVAAAALRRDRETVFARLRRQGAVVVEGDPARLASGLLEHYLEIKRRGSL